MTKCKYYAAFTPYRNHCNFEMTTRDIHHGAVHVLGLGIMLFYGNTIHLNRPCSDQVVQQSGGTSRSSQKTPSPQVVRVLQGRECFFQVGIS